VTTTIELCSLLLVGWISGAELGSWCCVQPVVARLPYEQFVAAEKGMLATFGRIMPVLMPLSGVLAVALIVVTRAESSSVLWLRVGAGVCVVLTVVTTLTINVPINARTATWQLTDDASEWQRMRERWHLFQGIRGGLFTCAFVLLATALIVTRRQ
jgi:uncharacterized membrane protein